MFLLSLILLFHAVIERGEFHTQFKLKQNKFGGIYFITTNSTTFTDVFLSWHWKSHSLSEWSGKMMNI